MKESFVFLADGFEEIEALTVVDVLRRAEMPVRTVSISTSTRVVGAHGVAVNADVIYDPTLFDEPRWLILPGGMPGATNLYEFAPLHGLLAAQKEASWGRIAAICAAPAVVLGQLGLLKGVDATCYPGFEDLMEGAHCVDAPVVNTGKFVLGNGPANALLWALTIVKAELGITQAQHIANGMLLYPRSDDDADFYFG